VNEDYNKDKYMADWLWMVGFLAAWVLLTRWLLPKLGVPT